MSDDLNPYKAPESDLAKPETTVPEEERYTPLMVEHLKNTRPWVLFISILLIIGMAFMVLGGLGMMAGGGMMRSLGGGYFGFLGFVYIIIAGIYVPLIVFLMRYASSIKNLLTAGKTESLEQALRYQKSYWKYSGILAIVMIALVIIGVIIIAAVGASSMRNFY